MKSKVKLPKEMCIDNTMKLLKEGYLFIPNRVQKYHSNIFQTRLLGQKVICMRGEDSAKLFYNDQLFTRKGAAPRRIQQSLFGKKAIQTIDGSKHEHRKKLFMSFMTPDRIDDLIKISKDQWNTNSKQWTGKNEIILYDEVELLLCQVACKWTGVPLKKSEITLRAMDFGKMVDSFGAVGPRHWQGRCARNRTERWIKNLIKEVRYQRCLTAKCSILQDVAWYRDTNGNLLDAKVAAVELINIIRPMVAIAYYITFGALALHDYPYCLRKLRANESNYTHMFVQEIRRYYPMAPFVGARVKKDFSWKHFKFKKGNLVLLDLYGTNHDETIWERPFEFLPNRFQLRDGNPYDYIPQGGGNYETGHRCAGEWVTIELLKVSMDYLANKLSYRVPLQDLSINRSRMPTLPKSGFIISKVKRLHEK